MTFCNAVMPSDHLSRFVSLPALNPLRHSHCSQRETLDCISRGRPCTCYYLDLFHRFFIFRCANRQFLALSFRSAIPFAVRRINSGHWIFTVCNRHSLASVYLFLMPIHYLTFHPSLRLAGPSIVHCAVQPKFCALSCRSSTHMGLDAPRISVEYSHHFRLSSISCALASPHM